MMILTSISRVQKRLGITVLQESRRKDTQDHHFGTEFHMKIPHDLDGQAKKNDLNRAAEPLDNYPFGKLIAH